MNTVTPEPKTFNPHKRFFGRGAGCSLFIPLALSRFPLLSGNAKLLYGRLCFHAGKDGECFPSETELCNELGIVGCDSNIGPSQLRTLRNYLAELKETKLILAEPRFNKRGERTTNAYRFLESEILKDGHTHRKKSSAGHRKEFSGKEGKNLSAKVRKKSSAVKEESSSKEESGKRSPGLKDEPQQSALTVQAAPSAKPQNQNSQVQKFDDDEKPKAKPIPREGNTHDPLSGTVTVLQFTASPPAKPDPWAELFKLTPSISVDDERYVKEQAEMKGATPADLLELAKQNPLANFTKAGPVAGLKWLVKNFNQKSMSAALHHATADALGIQRPQIIEQPRCEKCQNAGQLSETEFCDCPQGVLVKRAADKVAAKKAGREERTPARAAG